MIVREGRFDRRAAGHDEAMTAAEPVAVGPLAHVPRFVRVEGALFSRVRGVAPRGVRSRGASGGIFHVVVRGRGVARVEGADVAKLREVGFGPGDLLVFPHGRPHVIADAPTSAATWVRSLPVEAAGDGLPCVRAGAAGEADAELLCGTPRFGDEARELLLGHLPPLLHARAAAAAPFVDAAALLAGELARGEAGADRVVARLAEVRFVQAVRATVREGAMGPVWLRALGFLMGAPVEPWTVERLARRVGLSRTLFERFAARVGEPPLARLTRWRMGLARRLLPEPGASLAGVAERVGYGSEAAFARAFRREVGEAPARWRRAAGNFSLPGVSVPA